MSVLCSVAAFAQQYYGGLTGTVTDPDGAPAPNVSLTATNLNKGTVTRTLSNSEGIYRPPNLTPDRVQHRSRSSRLQEVQSSRLSWSEMNRTTTVDIALEIGALAESVTVSGAAPILEAESFKSTTTVEEKNVLYFPIHNGHDQTSNRG